MQRGRYIVGAAVLLIGALPAFGQVEVRPVLQPRQAETPLLTSEAVEKLKFTGDQKDKFAKIEAEYKDKYKAVQDKFRADIQGLRDREKYKEAQEKQQADSKKAREDGLAKVESLLTADQKTVFAQVKELQQQPRPGVRPLPIGGVGGGGIGQVLPPAVQQRLQLTEDQKKEIEKLQKEVEEKVIKLLNDQQKKQLEEMKKGVRPIRPAQPLPVQPVPRIRNVQPAVPAPPAVERK